MQDEKTVLTDAEELQKQLDNLLLSYGELKQQNADLTRQLNEELRRRKKAEDALLRANNALDAMHNSKRWRMASKLVCFIRKLVPVDSRREKLCRALLTLLRNPSALFHKTEPVSEKTPLVVPDTVPVRTGSLTQADYSVLQVPQWDEPTVSIIIPVYNQFEFTYHCVESILKNSGDITYEILIADDCSSDLTQYICDILPGVRHIRNEKNLRFLLNCNHAASYAMGKYVLFLNNDTQVMENWLAPLVTLIESADDIGMVGSKLIYPDGRLQEAGGIVWSDGTAWNYGNRSNPALPEFNYVKEADYISGASIMLPRALWEKIGGFDEAFVPAYCEDSDLAFTVRDRGYRVMYQPQSVVVHFEGVSNGTDTSTGQKQYQIVNNKKLYEKWKHVMEKHAQGGTNVFLAKDRSLSKKTLLFVDHYVPHFDRDAGSRTVFQYLKLFADKGYNVKFIGDDFIRHEPYTSVLQQMGIEVLYGPEYKNHIEAWLQENAHCFDYVFLNRPHIAPKYIDILRKHSNARIIYYGHDLTFLRLQRESEITGDAALLEETKDWQELELSIMKKADMSYYPSYVEVDTIHQLDPTINVKAIPAYLFDDVKWNGYDMNARKDIMFIGGFIHRPNVDAVKWMAEELLPELLKLLPDIKIHVLGSHAGPEIYAFGSKNLIIEGTVSDEELENFYRYSRLSLVPLRYGAGIKGKVVEALRYGTPVVTTSIGAEGLSDADGIMVIENDAKGLAHRIAEIYHDAQALTKMSRAGVEYIAEHFSPRNAVAIIGSEFDMK